MSAVAARRTPTVSGLRVAQHTLLNGLSTDGPLVNGLRENDIVRYSFAGRNMFVLGHPDYVDHVLHEAVERYRKSVEYELLRSVLGLSLFTDEGESWRRHRMLLTPLFAKRHLLGLVDLMIDPIEQFMERTDDGSDRIGVHMSRAMTELTLDVVGCALFGRGMADLAQRLGPTVTTGLRAAERTTRGIMLVNPPAWLFRAWANVLHHAPLLPPPLSRIQGIMRSVDEMVWQVIHDRQANPGADDDLLGLLLSVRDEATTFMLAGHETTANALSWMWYLLAREPEARERMLAEVDSVLGGRRPAADDLPNLTWTGACVQEAMRMFPPAWAIPRMAVEDDEIDGHRIPKGSSILIPIHSIHHDARWWPDPETFDPGRFLAERTSGRHRSQYLPFGGGRRICIGSSFALMEATLVTAIMSQRFTYELVPGHPVEPEATLTLRPRHGLRMVAVRRAE